MIHKYQEWLKESEKVEAAPAGEITEPIEAEPTAEDTPTPDAATAEPSMDEPAAPAEAQPEIDSAESEIEKFRELDETRRDAIRAFKKKQEEFLEIPDDIRKNPTEEADKTKVDTLKAELIELNKTMKDAITAWNSFNALALGIDDDADDEIEP
jgi:hypothetical protein